MSLSQVVSDGRRLQIDTISWFGLGERAFSEKKVRSVCKAVGFTLAKICSTIVLHFCNNFFSSDAKWQFHHLTAIWGKMQEICSTRDSVSFTVSHALAMKCEELLKPTELKPCHEKFLLITSLLFVFRLWILQDGVQNENPSRSRIHHERQPQP